MHALTSCASCAERRLAGDQVCCVRCVQEKAPHPKPDSVAAGNFKISIVGKLKDGKINQSVLQSYRKQMQAAKEGRGETAERQ